MLTNFFLPAKRDFVQDLNFTFSLRLPAVQTFFTSTTLSTNLFHFDYTQYKPFTFYFPQSGISAKASILLFPFYFLGPHISYLFLQTNLNEAVLIGVSFQRLRPLLPIFYLYGVIISRLYPCCRDVVMS